MIKKPIIFLFFISPFLILGIYPINIIKYLGYAFFPLAMFYMLFINRSFSDLSKRLFISTIIYFSLLSYSIILVLSRSSTNSGDFEYIIVIALVSILSILYLNIQHQKITNIIISSIIFLFTLSLIINFYYFMLLYSNHFYVLDNGKHLTNFWSGFYSNTQHYAGFLFCCISVYYFLFLKNKNKINFLLFIISTLALIISFSKTMIILTIIFIIFISIINSKNNKERIRFFLLLILLFFMIIMLLLYINEAYPLMLKRHIYALLNPIDNSSVQHRLHGYEYAFSIINTKFLTGVSFEHIMRDNGMTIHSTILMMISMYGVSGLLIFLILYLIIPIIAILKISIKKDRIYTLSYILFFNLYGLTIDYSHTSMILLFYISLIIIISISKKEENAYFTNK